jgi:hypothetical protein
MFTISLPNANVVKELKRELIRLRRQFEDEDGVVISL